MTIIEIYEAIKEIKELSIKFHTMEGTEIDTAETLREIGQYLLSNKTNEDRIEDFVNTLLL